MKGEMQVKPPQEAVEYRFDLRHVNILEKADRMTVSGEEKTLTALLPPKGCSYNCDFCAIKHIHTDIRVNEETAKKQTQELDQLLKSERNIDTLKLFNAGNIIYGSEHGSAAEIHEYFWELLPGILKKHGVGVLEIEVRIDEFVDSGREKQKAIIRERITTLANDLHQLGIDLRIILALEYIADPILEKQKKFPKAFLKGEQAARGQALRAIQFLASHNIPWLGYAMLGGRLHDRPLTSVETILSTVHTVRFGLEHGAREMIVNSLYLDPLQQREGGYYMPTEADMRECIRLLSEDLMPDRRVRLTTDAENVIKGTIGPKISQEFRAYVNKWNNARDQKAFFLATRHNK